ncbi:MAG: hypothetical protein JWO70_5033 [Betaproteobacteria bacterium]|nr:hypothetical protein [Betaproteobacteria bacterium]
MNRTLVVAAAVALAVSGAAFAKGSHSKRAAATGTTASEITQKDCQMLSVESARAACMRAAVRGNGGIDSAAVGMSSDASAGGQVGSGSKAASRSGGASPETPSRSNETSDPATYRDMPR